jgi:Ca2+-binding EF-hand superfamily protein
MLCIFFESVKMQLLQEDILFILRKLNKNDDGRISMEEFKTGI